MTLHARPVALVAAVGLAATAQAQSQAYWTTQFQFAQTPTGAPIAGNNLLITAAGTYTFYVRVGIFNFSSLDTAAANHGLFNWTGAATVAGLQAGETPAVNAADSRIQPFDYGPATTFGGAVANAGSSITGINCALDVAGGATSPWLWDTTLGSPSPQPTSPVDWAGGPFADRGINSYTNVWRFTVNVTSFSLPNIVITFTGQAGPVILWSPITSTPPADAATPGIVHFIGITPNPVLHYYEPVQLRLQRIPAPAGAGALGLGCLLAARRRRT